MDRAHRQFTDAITAFHQNHAELAAWATQHGASAPPAPPTVSLETLEQALGFHTSVSVATRDAVVHTSHSLHNVLLHRRDSLPASAVEPARQTLRQSSVSLNTLVDPATCIRVQKERDALNTSSLLQNSMLRSASVFGVFTSGTREQPSQGQRLWFQS